MRHGVAAELLKLRTTRGIWGYVLAIVALAGIGAAGTIGGTRGASRLAESFQPDLVSVGGVSGIIALLLGITMVTVEFRQGTITPTFLVTPQRERVLAAKALAGGLAGLLMAVLALVVVAAVAIPWLAAIDVPLRLGDRDILLDAGGIVLAGLLWALVGVAVGGAIHSQIAALTGALIWFLVGEPLFGGLLGVVDLDGVTPYLPGAALESAAHVNGADLSFWAGLAVSLAYVAAIGALAIWRTRRKDVT